MANESKQPAKAERRGNEKPVSLAPLDFEEVIDGLFKIAPPQEKPPQKKHAAPKLRPAARRKTH
jgi:hypothetical protein